MLKKDITLGSIVLKLQDHQITVTTNIGDFTFGILTSEAESYAEGRASATWSQTPVSMRNPEKHLSLMKAYRLDSAIEDEKWPEGWEGFVSLPHIYKEFVNEIYEVYDEWIQSLEKAKKKEFSVIKS